MGSDGSYIKGQTEAMESFKPTPPSSAAITGAPKIQAGGAMPELTTFAATVTQALQAAGTYVTGVGQGFTAFEGMAAGSGKFYAAGDAAGAGAIVASVNGLPTVPGAAQPDGVH